jgi:hypothetical protein
MSGEVSVRGPFRERVLVSDEVIEVHGRILAGVMERSAYAG